jgi:exopolysaccharide production protein ExoZ
MRRYKLLDVLRGFAALWVLWCHSFSGDYKHLDFSNHAFLLFTQFMAVGYLGVSIFFLISGFGIAGSMERHRGKAGDFLWRRIKRVLPPYWISLVLVLAEVALILLLKLQKNSALPSLGKVLKALPLLFIPDLPHLNPVYWSLGYEMHFYLLATLSLLVLYRFKSLFYFFDLLSAVVLVTYANNFSFGAWDTLFVIRYYWLDFFCGILLFRILSRPKDWKPWVYSAFWLYAIFHVMRDAPMRYFAAPVTMIVLLILYPFDTSLSKARWMKPLFWLGKISFSLFLTNVMIGPKLLGVVDRLTIMSTGVYLVTLVIGTAGSLLLADMFYRYIELPLAEKLD